MVEREYGRINFMANTIGVRLSINLIDRIRFVHMIFITRSLFLSSPQLQVFD